MPKKGKISDDGIGYTLYLRKNIKFHVANNGKKLELYKQAQYIFYDDAPCVSVALSVVVVPDRKNVMDFELNPGGNRCFLEVWFDKE